MKKGSIVKGRITAIKDYGAFVKVLDHDGLIHISEFSDDYVKSIEDIVSVGDVVDLEILEVDYSNKKLRLSYKSVNRIHHLILQSTKIEIGFKSLEEKLDEWIKIAYKLVKESNN